MRKLTNRFALILTLAVLLSCSHISEHIRKGHERYLYERTIRVIERTIPGKIQRNCSYRTELPPPKPRVAISFPDNRRGEFDPATNEVVYLKGQFNSLAHEYQHYLNRFADRKCLNEVTAYYLVRILDLEDRNNKLKSENMRLRNRR